MVIMYLLLFYSGFYFCHAKFHGVSVLHAYTKRTLTTLQRMSNSSLAHFMQANKAFPPTHNHISTSQQ